MKKKVRLFKVWFFALLLLLSHRGWAQPPFEIATLLNRTGTNLPTQIGTAGNARAAALYQNRFVIAPSRQGSVNVWVWDTQNPESPPFSLPLGTGIITTQTFAVNYVRVVGNSIYVSSLTTNPTLTGWGQGPFRIYRWTSLVSEPEVVLNFTALTGRLGDAFSIIGDPAGNGKIIAHINGTKEFRIWNFENGVLLNQNTPDLMVLKVPEANLNNHGILNPIPGEPNLLIGTSNNRGLFIGNLDGDISAQWSTDIIDATTYDPNIFYIGGKRYLTYTINNHANSTVGARYQIVDISEGATIVDAFNAITTASQLSQKIVHDFRLGVGNNVLTATNSVGTLENGNVRILAHVVSTGFVAEELRMAAPAPTARIQLIHNSADASAAKIDLYVNGVLDIEDLAFRTATPFEDVPAGVDINLVITPANTPIENGVPITVNFENGKTYVVVAAGNISTTGFDPAKPFNLFVYDLGREAAINPANVDLLAFHGSTDAPIVSVWETGVGNVQLIQTLDFGKFSGYLSLPLNDYILEIRDATGTSKLAAYKASLSTLGLQGTALTVVASGFLNPANNSNGPAFGLFAARAEGGPLLELPFYDDRIIIKEFPYVQNFESGTFDKSGWGVKNPDGSLFEWQITNLDNHTAGGVFSARHRWNPTTKEEGWLVSPAIVIPQNDNFELSFLSRNQHPSFYGKNSLRVSLGSPDPADNQFVEVWTTAQVLDTWVQTKVSLAAYAGKTIYVAFVYEGEDAHGWFLDDIQVGEKIIPPTYKITFDVKNAAGNPVPDAIITLGAETNPAGNYVFAGLSPGVFPYTIKKIGFFDATGNVTVETTDVSVTVTLQIDNTSVAVVDAAGLRVFPNPVRNVLNIASAELIREIRLMDMLGQVVYTTNVTGDSHQINVSGMRNGIYFVQIMTSKGIFTQRVYIQQ